MKLDSGDESMKTLTGSLCSILLLMVTIFYASLKFDILMAKKEVRIVSAVEDMYFSDTDQLDYSDGMNIAAGFWTGSDELLDPSYGELIFVKQSWGYDADGNWNDKVEQIQDHACTQDELNISEVSDNPKFFEPSKDTAGMVNFY